MPPPAAAHLSMAAWMALVLTTAVSLTAPKSFTVNTFLPVGNVFAPTLVVQAGATTWAIAVPASIKQANKDSEMCFFIFIFYLSVRKGIAGSPTALTRLGIAVSFQAKRIYFGFFSLAAVMIS